MHNELIIGVDVAGEFQLPDEIMARRGWEPGSRILVELLPDGVRLRDAPSERDVKDAPS